MSYLKLFLYFLPFLKEVFISSKEEKRVWFGRFAIIVIIAVLFVGYINRHKDAQQEYLGSENAAMRMELDKLHRDYSFLSEKQAWLQDKLTQTIMKYEKLDADYKNLRKAYDKLVIEQTQLKQHTIQSDEVGETKEDHIHRFVPGEPSANSQDSE